MLLSSCVSSCPLPAFPFTVCRVWVVDSAAAAVLLVSSTAIVPSAVTSKELPNKFGAILIAHTLRLHLVLVSINLLVDLRDIIGNGRVDFFITPNV